MKFNLHILLLALVLIAFAQCTSDDGDNFEEIPPEGFAELTINVRQWTSSTTWENRGNAIVHLYETEADRSNQENETHLNNTDTLGNCVFIDVIKSRIVYLESTLADGDVKIEDIELTDADIQSRIIAHEE